MSIIHLSAVIDEEPTAADLAAIEQEGPLLVAEMNLLDAEIRFINAGQNASDLDRRRIRRAERRVFEAARDLSVREAKTEVVA